MSFINDLRAGCSGIKKHYGSHFLVENVDFTLNKKSELISGRMSDSFSERDTREWHQVSCFDCELSLLIFTCEQKMGREPLMQYVLQPQIERANNSRTYLRL